MKYKIIGKYLTCASEVIDEVSSLPYAEQLLEEYIMAFGHGWVIWLEGKHAD